MVALAVRRPHMKLAGRALCRGDVIDSTDFPRLDQHKWAQLIEHRFVDLLDQPGRPVQVGETVPRADLAAVVAGEVPVASVQVFACPSCSYIGNTAQGLKVHTGRKHKE